MESIDTEDFISEIEAQQVLWNTACEQHNKNTSKRNAWEEVILKFDPHFKNKTTGEKTVLVS
jgi:hypothetical protein